MSAEIEFLRVTNETLARQLEASAAKLIEMQRMKAEMSQLLVAIHDVHEVFNTLLDVDGKHTTFGSPAQRLQALLYQHKSELEARDATIKRLRDVAVKALPMNGKCSHGIAGRTCSDAVEELRLALSALVPEDLGGEGAAL